MASRGHVFVVEDHPATAHGLKAFLELRGYTVTTAADAKSAIKLAKKIVFDVLVCDLSLPDENGWDLLKKLALFRPIRALAFSAWDSAGDIARSKEAGFLDHIVKGCPPEDLVAAIERARQET